MKEINGTITLKSGLHIGAGDMELKIGGTDNSVVKHPTHWNRLFRALPSKGRSDPCWN